MKYYSDVVNRVFNTEEELIKAEKENEEKLAKEKAEKEQRSLDAKVVEEAYKKASEAYKEAREKMSEFIKKHGSYHKTYTTVSPNSKTLFDYFFDEFLF